MEEKGERGDVERVEKVQDKPNARNQKGAGG